MANRWIHSIITKLTNYNTKLDEKYSISEHKIKNILKNVNRFWNNKQYLIKESPSIYYMININIPMNLIMNRSVTITNSNAQ